MSAKNPMASFVVVPKFPFQHTQLNRVLLPTLSLFPIQPKQSSNPGLGESRVSLSLAGEQTTSSNAPTRAIIASHRAPLRTTPNPSCNYSQHLLYPEFLIEPKLLKAQFSCPIYYLPYQSVPSERSSANGAIECSLQLNPAHTTRVPTARERNP